MLSLFKTNLKTHLFEKYFSPDILNTSFSSLDCAFVCVCGGGGCFVCVCVEVEGMSVACAGKMLILFSLPLLTAL